MNQKTKKTNRPMVFASIIVAMFITAIEGTIVSTAMPSIVGELGGFSLFSWAFSTFLLAQAVTIPIYGKFADLKGRKPIFTFGVVIFLIGSVLCGLAQSMKMLIFFRLLQGIGAGAIGSISTTIIGDIYNIEERAKIQGYISSVWGISSIVGPALGGIFVQYLHWSWVFWVNIPLGIISLAGIWLYLHEEVEGKEHQVDYPGAALLFIYISSLMFIFIEGGVTWPWVSWPIFILTGLFLLSFILFIKQEKRAVEPVMPLQIWRNPLIAVANIASLTTGAVMIGVTTFLPTFVQGVMGLSPTVAGFTLCAMSIGWPLASAFSGKIMLRYGYRKTSIAGGIILILGAIFFLTLVPEKGPIWAGIGSFLIGVGMGLTSTTFIVSIQSSVDWQTRGVATASNMFMRILGNTIGAALLGGILNIRMSSFLKAQPANIKIPQGLDITNVLLEPQKRASLSNEVLEVLKKGLTISLHNVYWGVFILSIVSLLLVLFLQDHKKDEKTLQNPG